MKAKIQFELASSTLQVNKKHNDTIMTKMAYQKPDLQIIKIEAEEVIAASEGGTGKPGSGGNTNPGVTSNSYTNTYNNSNRWEE